MSMNEGDEFYVIMIILLRCRALAVIVDVLSKPCNEEPGAMRGVSA